MDLEEPRIFGLEQEGKKSPRHYLKYPPKEWPTSKSDTTPSETSLQLPMTSDAKEKDTSLSSTKEERHVEWPYHSPCLDTLILEDEQSRDERHVGDPADTIVGTLADIKADLEQYARM